MTVAPPPASSPKAQTQLGFFRLSVDDYHKIGERGILTPDDKVELIEGLLVRKWPQDNSPPTVYDALVETLSAFGPQAVPHPALTEAMMFRLAVADYDAMVEAGILTTAYRVELLDGYLVAKMPQNDPHASAVEALGELLVRHAPAGWRKRIQLPVRLDDGEPEPDGVIARGNRGGQHPTAADIGLIVEVADSSLRLDRTVKGIVYARNVIPTYWIVNIPEAQFEVYTQPSGPAETPGYAHRQDFKSGQAVPLVLDGQTVATIPVGDLLP